MHREGGARMGGRSLLWKHDEIKELLALWGGEKVQEALRNHQNIVIFESITKGMVVRGFI